MADTRLRLVVAWNAERCKFLDECRVPRRQSADVLLLSNSIGAWRSGQHRCARGWRLGCVRIRVWRRVPRSWTWGASAERARVGQGRTNAVGYHGNAILARGEILQPRLVRLERRGDWFDGARGESRVGGRCAVLAQLASAVARRPSRRCTSTVTVLRRAAPSSFTFYSTRSTPTTATRRS
jgi:hypothetical protein